MKPKLTLLAVIVASITVIGLAGCATKNPQYTPIAPGQPETNTVPQYIPDPRINQWSNTVASVAQGLAPVNPYAGITSWALTAAFGIFGGISGLIARSKSGALSTMAAGVVKAGAAQAVLDHASNTDHFVAVADAVNSQTGANQTNTGAPKT